MGVTSLWPILAPCARPTPLPTLNRKRLAVDASIWIYQFLKAVRDKEGNALRNSHVVGFFRRICKLLFFGIKPVFVFDGGAPALKRQTVANRRRRREGRREDAVRTAGRLLAVQMQRRGEEEVERRRRERESGQREAAVEEEVIDEASLVYAEENAMTAQERQASRKFFKKDAYHLPELTSGIEGMGQPNDPRIMSTEELEEYARQFQDGEDVNLYDFSKINFDGDFFMSLPAGDRYNILNAARLRSRLRMGLSKEQLEDMFPDRMAFSRFQIERVKERNELTQRLMNLNGMNGSELADGGRIAGEKGREYVLVRNEGVEGGWALGVVSTDKTAGDKNKPIDVDAERDLHLPSQDESEDEFEDVPVEGLNRLPKMRDAGSAKSVVPTAEISGHGLTHGAALPEPDEPDSLFVPGPEHVANLGNNTITVAIGDGHDRTGAPSDDEESHLAKAIALSLQQNHDAGTDADSNEDEAMFEDVPMISPTYKQRAVEKAKPITTTNGKMVAHIVNNRANAAVPKRRAISVSSGSDSDMDMQSAMRKAKKAKLSNKKAQSAPVAVNVRNPFDGPLPFEKLEFRQDPRRDRFKTHDGPGAGTQVESPESADELEGGFVKEKEKAKPKPLPPWLASTNDIRDQVKDQNRRDIEIYAEDKNQADEEQRRYEKEHGVIQIESSDEDSDIEEISKPLWPVSSQDTHEEASKPSSILSNLGPTVTLPSRDESHETVVREENDLAATTENTELEMHGSPSRSSSKEADFMIETDPTNHGVEVVAPSVDELQGQVKVSPLRSQSQPRNDEDTDRSLPLNPPKNPDTSLPQSQDDLPREDTPADDVDVGSVPTSPHLTNKQQAATTSVSVQSRVPLLPVDSSFAQRQADMIADIDDHEFSDSEDDELMAQLAVEAEEHARFASTLNHKSERENQEAYEQELKALRTQQKKDRRDADEVSQIMITECQALLRLFGIPYITAPMEAEAQCAELVRIGLVDGIVTDDSDIFLFGGTRVYKNMFNSNKFVECYLSNDIEKELSLSRLNLVSVAHLLGSDYTEGLVGVGPVTAIEIISEFSAPDTGLQEFADWWDHVAKNPLEPVTVETSTFRKKFRRAQAAKLLLPPGFPSAAVTEAYLHPDVDSATEPFQWGVPDLDKLREYLMATIGWTQERTDEVLVPVIRDMNRREAEGTQSNITRFFEGGIGAGARGLVNGNEASKAKGSRRMQDAVGKLKARAKGKSTSNAVGGSSLTMADRAQQWANREDARADDQSNEAPAPARAKRRTKAKKATVADVDGSND